MATKDRFWNVELRVLLRWWWIDISTFVLTALTFVGLALPVIIPTLVLWFLYSIDFKMPQ